MKYTSKIALVCMLFSTQVTFAQTAGCTDPYATNYNAAATSNDGSCTYPVTHNTPLLKGALNPIITESSGLVWTNGKLWTHNDSGNPAEIYSIDTTNGSTLQTVVIDNFPNVDWEDITADSAYIYISDCGNNSGTRTDLKILKIAKSAIGSGSIVHVNAQAINVSYTDQTSFASSSTHNFDCESVISIKDSLYLFTKDRGDLSTRVYRVPKVPGTYALSPYTTYNVNGLITGADYNPVTNEVVLIGYFSGHANSFMWFLNDFKGNMFFSGNKRRIEIGNGTEWQTEAVCYITPTRFFVSCETTDNISASLFVSNKSWPPFGPSAVGSVIAPRITFYPNPSTGVLHINDVPARATYIIVDAMGRTVQSGTVHEGDNYLDLARLTTGTYIMQVTNADGTKGAAKIVKE